MMMVFCIVNLCLGTMLAQCFKVYVLMPVSVMAVALAIGTRFILTDSLFSMGFALAAAVASMQVGYFIGLSVQNRLPMRFRLTSRLSSYSHPAPRNPMR
jgi:hypothetical protein